MPPPPPPPPGAPPPPPAPVLSKLGGSGGKGERKDLLKDIQSGAKLKKTKTNDRSAPLVSGNKPVQNSASRPEASGGSPGSASTDAQSSQFTGPLPGIGGLFAGGMPTLKKTKGGVNTGRAPGSESVAAPSASNGSSSNPINNKFINSSTSSLNSSPSLSPSPSHVSTSTPSVSTSTPTHTIPDVSQGTPAPNIASLASNISNVNLTKPQPPASKPSFSRPQNGGPIHPSSRPPPPPIGNKTNLGRNQTIGHGPQGRPQIPNYEKRRSRDDSSIGNGQMSSGSGVSGPPPPPPVRTVSQNQLTNSNRVPTRAPPPPPPSHKRPSQPPPPPPSQSSHSSTPQHQPSFQPPTKALPPPPPGVSQASGDPPTPPTRRESIYRTGQANNNATLHSTANGSLGGESFELKFASRFKTLQFLPPPEPFSGSQKTYPSKQTLPVRQGSQIKRTPAPPPPPGGIPPPPGSHAPAPPPPGGGAKMSMYDVGHGHGRPPLPSARQLSVTTTTGVL